LETDRTTYRVPPQAIVDLVDAPPTPHLSLDPTRRWVLFMQRPDLPPLSELARPELRLAGMRIDPALSGPSRAGTYTGYTVGELCGGPQRAVTGVPEGAGLGQPRWSPGGNRIAFLVRTDAGLSVWTADLSSCRARPLTDPVGNAVFGSPLAWLPDGEHLICRLVPPGRGRAPEPPPVPSGPVIQQSGGREAPSRTYQDLLRSPLDEALFEHYAASVAVVVSVSGGHRPLPIAGLIRHLHPSPDGRFLLVERIERPYSYLVPYYRFAHRIEVFDLQGRLVREVARLPAAEEVPIAFDAVAEGPRGAEWREDADAELVWCEAQDGGDPRKTVDVRDRLVSLRAPFDGAPRVLAEFEMRFAGLTWGSDSLAVASERRWKDRRARIWRLRPGTGTRDEAPLFDRSWEDRYGDPGSPLTTWTPRGTRVLLTEENERFLYLSGDGASPEGDRPFLDRFDLETRKTTRLMRSEAPYYERPLQVVGPGPQVLLSREKADAPADFHVRDLSSGRHTALTAFPHPYPSIREAKKELIRYTRADGVGLTATLHLPPGHRAGDPPLPTLLWAYPREFKSAAAAGQVKDSPHRFTRLSPPSPLYLLAQGYAILDGPAMPIVGEGEQEANDRYVEQLAESAKAAVDEVVRRGVTDKGRVAVGGHSYGAFMAANLLAHTDLFRAGIAQSGAYNRTLTPFGFQAEERTIWEAPEVYAAMSPFMHAHRIKAPLLLIHGEADNNAGTFPMQSERFYNALKGHGAKVRLVMLPHESHGYRARESVLHVLWEITTWLDEHLKNGKA
jgi:dipeptidyl aminopeptidase/acylaminoacyl peptidase